MLGLLFWLLFLLYLVSSAVLILVVLIQSGKGGGLSGLVGAGSALGDSLGATGAEKTLNRWTSYCAVGFLVLTIVLVILGQYYFGGSALDEVPVLQQPTMEAAPEAAPAAVPADVRVDLDESEGEEVPAPAEGAVPIEAPVAPPETGDAAPVEGGAPAE